MDYNVKRMASVAAAAIPAAMDEAGVAFSPIGNVCWAEAFPYKPDVKFRMAHCGDAVLLHYVVTEDCVRATCANDDEAVWNDSCVECFLSPAPPYDTYYNIECNCTGTLLVGYGHPKRFGARERGGLEVTGLIERWASLGREPFGERRAKTTWEVALRIPLAVFFAHKIASLDGLKAKANLYKCGDALPVPHYLAWGSILTEKPDFHRPDFFKEIVFS